VQNNVSQICEPLARNDAQGRPQPVLAESWDISPDYKQIKFNLRKGVQWHNNRAFVSADVKHSVLRVRDPKVNLGNSVVQSNWWTSIETPDANTVVFGSETPRPTMFDFWGGLNIIDPVTVPGPEPSVTTSIGTGPFRFVEWDRGTKVVMGKNTNYWVTGKPYLDQVEQQFIGDLSTLSLNLEAGALDLISGASARDAQRLRTNTAYKVVINPNSGTFFTVIANVTAAGLENKQVRQALNFAIDRQRIIDASLLGVGTPISLPWAPSSAAYDNSKNPTYRFDLDRARSMLAAAGASNLAIDISWSTGTPVHAEIAQIISADLAKIGVRAGLRGLDRAVWLDELSNLKYSLSITGAPGATAHPSSILTGAFFGHTANRSGFVDETYRGLVAQLLLETVPDRQQALYRQINEVLLDQSWAMPLSPTPPVVITNARVQDVGFGGGEAYRLENIWMSA
jgi:peptide/nickel transport system substrate-binding protein